MSKTFSVLINKKIKKFNNKSIIVDLDKSITHRCFFIAANCIGVSKIKGLISEDINTTINSLRLLGIKILKKKKIYHVYGNGISGFKKFNGTIYCGNSGTTSRSILGLLSCYPYPVTITGDPSLRKRPFKRLTHFLEKIGANIIHPLNRNFQLPIKICGTKNWALAQRHNLKIPSAQIKTALIYAGLQTPGITEIIETPTRDHAEIILKYIGADLKVKKINKNKNIISVKGLKEMHSFTIDVPSDPSSACFFVVQTLLSKNSSLLIKKVCINKTRYGFIKVLKKMSGKIKILNKKKILGEEIADIFVQSSNLKSINCPKNLIVSCVDDLPAIWIACALAKGTSTFKGISELRLKESDRIKSMSEGLKAFNIKTSSTKDSLKIFGSSILKKNKQVKISSSLDHRVAMCFFIFAQVTGSSVLINGFETVKSSFPNFLNLQRKIGAKYEIKKN
jgi:3-phosphoshikimate 1-carboxyvinyltransferase